MDEKKIDKKLGVLIVAVAVLIVSVTGSTFAYFALSVTSNSEQQIAGETAKGGSGDMQLSVEKITTGNGGTSSASTTKTGKFVPQLESALGSAVGAEWDCVDSKGNTACAVYKITVTNNSTTTAATNLTGVINFTTYTGSYLRWKRIPTATTVGEISGVAASTNAVSASSQSIDLSSGTQCDSTVSSGCTSFDLGTTSPDNSKEFYIVVWLDENGSDQTDTDQNRTFAAEVTISAGGSGRLTSQIRS